MKRGVIITSSKWNDLSDAATFPAWHFFSCLDDRIKFEIWARNIPPGLASNVHSLDGGLLWGPGNGVRLAKYCLGVDKGLEALSKEMHLACEQADVIALFLRGGNSVVDYIAKRWGDKTVSHPTDNFMLWHARKREIRYAFKAWLEMFHLGRLNLRGVVFVAEEDRRYYDQWLPWSRTRAYAIPLGVDAEKFRPADPPTRDDSTCRFGFVGDLGYVPNTEACRVIIEKVLPSLPPNVRMIFGGKRPPDFLREAAIRDARISVTGYVPDIEDLYRDFDVMLAPILYGAGMQNKLLEASATGLPCITTTVCASAFSQIPPNFIIADDPTAIIRSALDLCHQRDHRIALGMAGRAHVMDKYSWKQRARDLLRLVSASPEV